MTIVIGKAFELCFKYISFKGRQFITIDKGFTKGTAQQINEKFRKSAVSISFMTISG